MSMQPRHLAPRALRLAGTFALQILLIGMSVKAYAGQNPKSQEATKPQKPAKVSGFEAIGLHRYQAPEAFRHYAEGAKLLPFDIPLRRLVITSYINQRPAG